MKKLYIGALLLTLSGCAAPNRAAPIVMHEQLVISNLLDQSQARRDRRMGLQHLCANGFEIACAQLTDEDMSDFLTNQQ